MATAKIGAIQAKLQDSSREFQKLEAEMAGVIEARQRLDAQQAENESVLKEFSTLKSENTIYKLVGPGLVEQDPTEAKANVEKRLEFIKSEIKRVEGQINEHQEKANKKKDEREFQQMQGPSKAAA